MTASMFCFFGSDNDHNDQENNMNASNGGVATTSQEDVSEGTEREAAAAMAQMASVAATPPPRQLNTSPSTATSVLSDITPNSIDIADSASMLFANPRNHDISNEAIQQDDGHLDTDSVEDNPEWDNLDTAADVAFTV